MSPAALLFTWLAATACASSVFAASDVNPGQAREALERDVDEVASSAQQNAVSKLKGLLGRYRGTRQEAPLLLKLAELQQQNAAIRFRIAHSRSQTTRKALDLGDFKRTMKGAISTLSELISKYPNYEDVGKAYYFRGRGYEEIEDKFKAASDYLKVVKNHSELEETANAYMSLAEFSIQAQEHAKAVGYLKEVEKKPDSPFYPFALYKLSWAHYNLKSIPSALAYAEKHVAYYDSRREAHAKSSGLPTSDDAFRENMLLDATVFFMEGFEQRLPQYQVSEALAYFKKLESGPALGKMSVRFAKLLRSHGHEQDLNNWKRQILAQESSRPESLDVLLVAFENQVNKRRYPQMLASTADIVALFKAHPSHPTFGQARKMVLDTAESLQQVIIKNKKSDGIRELSVTLAAMYDGFTQLVPDSDPAIPKVHYNLAETLFEIQEYERAIENYRWIVQRGKWSRDESPASVADANLKSIAARYETLRARSLIPGKIEAKSFAAGSNSKLDPQLEEWITWIDTQITGSSGLKGKNAEAIANFLFESNRCLYASGHIDRSVERLHAFSTKHPGSRYAAPSASLALDTYIVSKDWQRVENLANDLQDIRGWNDPEFNGKLRAAAGDASYKLTESAFQAKLYEETLNRAERFLRHYSGNKGDPSSRLADVLYIASRAALEIRQPDKAHAYLNRLIGETQGESTVKLMGQSLLSRAQIRESQYDLEGAVEDLIAYASKEKQPSIELKRRILTLAWISSDPGASKRAREIPGFCAAELAGDCDAAEGLSMARSLIGTSEIDSKTTELAFARARKGPPKNSALWASIALQGSRHLAWRDRIAMLKTISTHWEELDPMAQYSLIPLITHAIPGAVALNRTQMSELAPLRANARYIQRRVEVIREVENASAKLMKLPWARIRALVLNEVAGLYLDLSQGIAKLPAPKDLSESDRIAYEDTVRQLVMPFEEKGQEMRSKAFEMASLFAIEPESFKAITEPYFKDNPSAAAKLLAGASRDAARPIDLKFLQTIDPDSDWPTGKDIVSGVKSRDVKEVLRARWARAIEARHLAQVAFFLQELKERGVTDGPGQQAVKSVSLAAAGAQGEALAELESAVDALQEKRKVRAQEMILSHAQASLAKEKTTRLIEQMQKESSGESQARAPAAH